MKDRLAKLIDVKSIVTILITGVFAYLAITKYLTAEQFLTIFTVIIAFYFGTQSAKQSTVEELNAHPKNAKENKDMEEN